MKLLILHSALMMVKITTMLDQAHLIQRQGNGLDIAQEQVILALAKPGIGLGRLVGEQGLSGLSQMLRRMKPIDNLGTIREIIIGYIPNPLRAIGGHTGLLSCRHLMRHGQRPQRGAELLDIAQHGSVGHLLCMRKIGILPRVRVMLKPQHNVVYCPDLEFFPAFAANIDHAAIHAHAFDYCMVGGGSTQLHPFWTDLRLLMPGRLKQLFAIGLHPSPQAARPDATVSDTLTHLDTLSIGQRLPSEGQPLNQTICWAIPRLYSPPVKPIASSLGKKASLALFTVIIV